MAVGDIYQVRFFQQYAGEDCMNVWYYRMTSGSSLAPGNATHLWSAFDNLVLAALEDLQSVEVTYVSMDTLNLRLPSDYFSFNFITRTGLREPEEGADFPAPTWVAWSHKSARPFPGTRSARKRFAGLYETDMSINQLSGSFQALGAIGTLNSAMAADLTNTGDSFEPVVVKRPIVLGTNPPVSYVCDSWSLVTKLSHQDSRGG